MQIYVLTFIVSIVLCCLYNNSNHKFFNRLIIILLVTTLSLPYYLRDFSIGTDTIAYVDYFDIIRNTSSFSDILLLVKIYKIEIGFLLFTKILTFFIKDNHVIFFVYALISFTLFINFTIKNRLNLILSLAGIFSLFPLYYYNFNILRQSFATFIILYSFSYLVNNQLKKYIYGVVFASLFHQAAIISLIFILIYKFKNRLYRIIGLLPPAGFLLMIVIFKILPNYVDKYNSYLESTTTEQPFGILWTTLILGITIISMIIMNKVPTKTKENLKTIIIIMVIFLTYNTFLYFLGFSNQGLNRIAFYFLWPSLYIIPLWLRALSRKDYYIGVCLAFLFYLALATMILYMQPDNIVPFKFKF